MNKHTIVASIAGIAVLLACGTAKDPAGKVSSNYSTINKSYISTSVKPSEDFFLFANANWIKNTEIPASESRWGSFNELDKSNKDKIKAILAQAESGANVQGSDSYILWNYKKAFMDMDTRNRFGLNPILDELKTAKMIQNNEDLIQFIAGQHSVGVSMLFGFGIGQDLKNVDKHVAYFGQGGIGLPNRDYYFDENKGEILKNYEIHIAKIFQLARMDEKTAAEAARSVIEFETRLADKMYKPAQMRQPELTYNPMSMSDFANQVGKLDMNNYLKAVRCPEIPEQVIVSNPEYFQMLPEVIDVLGYEKLQAYLQWCILNHYAGMLGEEFVNQNFNFYGKILSGKKNMKPMDEQVIEEMTGLSIGEVLGKAFVKEHFSESAQKRVNTMVDNLLAVYAERIEKLDWMSEETKVEALKKLNAIGRKLGFPNKWEDFSSIKLSPSTYIQNFKAVMLYDHMQNMADLNKPVDKDKWGMPAHMVNAYYHPLLNEIAFPAGIMQPPFFDDKAEDAVNYGGIGMVIGHEFTHGFDDMGSQFAADGSYTNWWQESDRSLFEEKTAVLGNTFEQFCPIEDHCVNPALTMGENIADLGGLTMAYYAYARTPEFKSGIKREGYSPAQRFFISYAQLWKIKYTDEELMNRLENDPHSPGMYRVNGPLKNCPEFFEAFGIQEGDAMRNPSDKVAKIW